MDNWNFFLFWNLNVRSEWLLDLMAARPFRGFSVTKINIFIGNLCLSVSFSDWNKLVVKSAFLSALCIRCTLWNVTPYSSCCKLLRHRLRCYALFCLWCCSVWFHRDRVWRAMQCFTVVFDTVQYVWSWCEKSSHKDLLYRILWTTEVSLTKVISTSKEHLIKSTIAFHHNCFRTMASFHNVECCW